MAIVASDIHTRISTTSGAAGNSTAPGAAGTSLGKYMCNADLTDNSLNNLFPDATGAENSASNVDYQCLFVYNATAGGLTWQNVLSWINSQVAGGASFAIGVDTTAASAIGAAGAQALTIANKNTAPAGVTFFTPTSSTDANVLAVGNLAPATCRAIWVRRTCANTSALNSDGGVISFQGDTLA